MRVFNGAAAHPAFMNARIPRVPPRPLDTGQAGAHECANPTGDAPLEHPPSHQRPRMRGSRGSPTSTRHRAGRRPRMRGSRSPGYFCGGKQARVGAVPRRLGAFGGVPHLENLPTRRPGGSFRKRRTASGQATGHQGRQWEQLLRSRALLGWVRCRIGAGYGALGQVINLPQCGPTCPSRWLPAPMPSVALGRVPRRGRSAPRTPEHAAPVRQERCSTLETACRRAPAPGRHVPWPPFHSDTDQPPDPVASTTQSRQICATRHKKITCH